MMVAVACIVVAGLATACIFLMSMGGPDRGSNV